MDCSNEDLSPLEEAGWTTLPVPKPSAAFTDLLRTQTSDLVRRRARRRKWRVASGFALAYIVGVGNSSLWPRSGAKDLRLAQQVAPPRHVAPRTSQPRVEVASLEPDQLRAAVPGAPRAEQIRLLRLAGDRYFYDSADMRAALDCYRQVVELTPEENLDQPDPQDNWLLAEMKLSAAAGQKQNHSPLSHN